MLAVIYAQPRIGWQREKAGKVADGLKALGVKHRITSDPVRQDGLPILLGTTCWRALEKGPYLLIDRASFRDPEFVSLVRDGHGRRGDHRVPENPDPARWKRIGVPIEPWGSGPRKILCGQHASWCPTSLAEFYKTPATHFRRHPAADNPTGLPETRVWRDAGLAITLNSSVGVESVMAGVPTVTLDEGAMAWDVSGHSVDEVIKPPRQEWLSWLAWTQWSWDEIAEGKPWAHLL